MMVSAVTKIFVIIGTCILLAGCATDGAGLPSVACGVFGPLTYSRQHDTRPTIRGIIGHNAAGQKLCGWKPNAKS